MSDETYHWDGEEITREQWDKLRAAGINVATNPNCIPDAEHNIDVVWGAESAKDRRNRIAEGFAFALVSWSQCSWRPEGLASESVSFADALIAELDK